jgi:hypothetical protein
MSALQKYFEVLAAIRDEATKQGESPEYFDELLKSAQTFTLPLARCVIRWKMVNTLMRGYQHLFWEIPSVEEYRRMNMRFWFMSILELLTETTPSAIEVVSREFVRNKLWIVPSANPTTGVIEPDAQFAGVLIPFYEEMVRSYVVAYGEDSPAPLFYRRVLTDVIASMLQQIDKLGEDGVNHHAAIIDYSSTLAQIGL